MVFFVSTSVVAHTTPSLAPPLSFCVIIVDGDVFRLRFENKTFSLGKTWHVIFHSLTVDSQLIPDVSSLVCGDVCEYVAMFVLRQKLLRCAPGQCTGPQHSPLFTSGAH